MSVRDPTLSLAALAVAEAAINATLALDPQSLGRLSALEGKIIALAPGTLGMTLYAAPHGKGLHLMSFYDGKADTTLAGPVSSFLGLAAGARRGSFFSGELTIHGDVELGREFQRILSELDLDLEEHFSRVGGDVVAHQAGNLVRELGKWARHAGDSLRAAGRDYLQEEARILPTRLEVEEFARAVEAFRMDADRLEARLKQLRRKLEE